MSDAAVRMASRAMGTRFELVMCGKKASYLEGVGEEVFREITRIEEKLNYYDSNSQVREINAYAAHRPILLDPPLFHLLSQAKTLSQQSHGAFDITIAPLLRCWGFQGGSGAMPAEEDIAAARALVGMDKLILDPQNHTIAFAVEGMEIDLGAIGKGYAIDYAAELLRDYEIENAFLHGGTSSMVALGAPPDADAWSVALQPPWEHGTPLAYLALKNQTLSVSAPKNKGFEHEGKRYGHVLDPRSGRPAPDHLLAAIVCGSATQGDALSTALLAQGETFLEALPKLLPEGQALLLALDSQGKERLALSPSPTPENLFQEISETFLTPKES